jgi:hypothetical protein
LRVTSRGLGDVYKRQGSGIVGIFVSLLLARSNLRVLNLPGGSLQEELSSSALSVEGSPEFEIDSNFQRARPRIIGGASQIWGGRIREFDPWDFQERVWLNSNQIQWPITWEEMKTLYKSTYDILNITSSIMKSENISARIEAKEHEVDGLDFSGREIWLNEKNFYNNFRKEIRSNPHLLLPEGFHYVASKPDGRNSNDFDKIVSIASKNNVVQEVKTKYLILAMGAVENSRHLLNIHANKNTVTNKENLTLGRYYMVHLLTQYPHITKPNSDLNFRHVGNIQIRNTIQVKINVQSELKLANSLASFAPQDLNVLSLSNINESRKRAIQRYGMRAPLEVLRRTDRLLPLLKESLISSRTKSTLIGTPDRNSRMIMSLWSEQLPQESNHIALSKSIDTHGNRSVGIKLKFTDFDIHSMSVSASKIQQCLNGDSRTNLNSFYSCLLYTSDAAGESVSV